MNLTDLVQVVREGGSLLVLAGLLFKVGIPLARAMPAIVQTVERLRREQEWLIEELRARGLVHGAPPVAQSQESPNARFPTASDSDPARAP